MMRTKYAQNDKTNCLNSEDCIVDVKTLKVPKHATFLSRYQNKNTSNAYIFTRTEKTPFIHVIVLGKSR